LVLRASEESSFLRVKVSSFSWADRGKLGCGGSGGHVDFKAQLLEMKNVRFTTPTQQVHNTPSHEGGAQCVGHTLM
jgi:hypothetical protein